MHASSMHAQCIHDLLYYDAFYLFLLIFDPTYLSHKNLKLYYCSNIETIPETLTNLEILELCNCFNIETFF